MSRSRTTTGFTCAQIVGRASVLGFAGSFTEQRTMRFPSLGQSSLSPRVLTSIVRTFVGSGSASIERGCFSKSTRCTTPELSESLGRTASFLSWSRVTGSASWTEPVSFTERVSTRRVRTWRSPPLPRRRSRPNPAGVEMRDDPDEQEQIRRLRERGSHQSAPVTPPKAGPRKKAGRNKASRTVVLEPRPHAAKAALRPTGGGAGRRRRVRRWCGPFRRRPAGAGPSGATHPLR